MASELPKNAPNPRLCYLVKWPDFEGYGFNLHAEKAKTGQFIGKVDEGSPAELAGLREGDRIIEVNGVNISNENHRQVVERIKAMVNETILLVIDEEGDRYYKDNKVVIKGNQANVIYKKTPPSRPTKEEEVLQNNNRKDSEPSETDKIPANPKKSPDRVRATENDVDLNHKPTASAEESPKQRQDSPKPLKSESPKPVSEPKVESSKPVSQVITESSGSPKQTQKPKESPKQAQKPRESPKQTQKPRDSPKQTQKPKESPKPATKVVAEPSKPAETEPPKPAGEVKSNGATSNGSSKPGPISNGANATQNGPAAGDLNLNMSAAQMREMLANRKKRDPRNQSLDMREKYHIVQQM